MKPLLLIQACDPIVTLDFDTSNSSYNTFCLFQIGVCGGWILAKSSEICASARHQYSWKFFHNAILKEDPTFQVVERCQFQTDFFPVPQVNYIKEILIREFFKILIKMWKIKMYRLNELLSFSVLHRNLKHGLLNNSKGHRSLPNRICILITSNNFRTFQHKGRLPFINQVPLPLNMNISITTIKPKTTI